MGELAAEARSARLSITAAVTLVVVFACFQVIARGQTFGGGRYLAEVVPSVATVGDRARSLELAEWWDGVGLGVPFAANPDHAALYPPAWIAGSIGDAAGSSLAGADLLVLLHLLLLGVGVAMASRRLGASDVAAIIAGGAAAASGAASWAIDGPMLGPLAWAPWIWLAAVGVGETRGLARARAAAWLAAAAAMSLYAGSLATAPPVALVAVVAAVAASPARRRLRALGAAVGALLFAAACAAAVLVPALQVTLAHAPETEPATWAQLAGVLWPGDALAPYVGVPIAMLALLSARRAPLLLATAAAVIAAARLGAPGALVGAVLLCLLAGVGITTLLESVPRQVLATAAVVAVFAIALALLGAGLGATMAVGLAAVAIGLRAWAPESSLVVPALGAVLVGHLIAQSWQMLPRVPRADFDTPPRLIAGALAVASPVAPGSLPPRLARPSLPGFVDRADSADALRAAHDAAAPNSATRFGIDYVRGRDRAISPRLAAAWGAAALDSHRFLDLYGIELVALPTNVALASGSKALSTLPEANAVLVVNAERRPRAFVAARWRWVSSDEQALRDVFPVAVGVSHGLSLLTVHLDGTGQDGGPEAATPARQCAISAHRPEQITLACPRDAHGYAVMLDSWAPGWTATVGGQERPVERADVLARAVRLDAGERIVDLTYRTPGLRLGGLVAGLAWLNLLVVAWLTRRRR